MHYTNKLYANYQHIFDCHFTNICCHFTNNGISIVGKLDEIINSCYHHMLSFYNTYAQIHLKIQFITN